MDGSSCTGPLLRAILTEHVSAGTVRGSLLFDFILIFFLISVNGFFAAAEMAVVTQNDNKIRQMADSGHAAAKRLLRFVDNKSRFLSTIQVAITLAGFLSSAFAADKLAVRLYVFVDPGLVYPSLRTLLVVLMTIVLSYFTLVFGELVPKRLAMRRPEQFAMMVSGILRFFDFVFRPFTKLLEWSTNLVLRILGIDPDEASSRVTEEEIRILVEAGAGCGDLQETEADLIKNIFAFDDKYVSEIMTPRVSITSVPLSSTYEEAVDIVAHASYSRFPVYNEDIDDIVGILIVKDLLRVPKSKRGADFKLESILRPAFFVPEVKKVDVLFREMKQQHTTLAVVVDEYGGTEGIVTMEDLLEEIVGEIEDEYDAPVTSVVVNADGSYVFSGLLTPAEAGRYVPELDELKEDDDFDTIAGFVLSLLGYIPEKGAQPEAIFKHLKFTVLEMDDRRISRIRLEVLPDKSSEDED
ncbi:MAG: HlyC/CorC family transporter [Clostridia bacterium]|nr:HlyC/CorC family transporter [Clostridia bacterium]MBP6950586.1 HlyC/CorC family transporter [Clostridia bacterium]